MPGTGKKVLFLLPYPAGRAPSQRFRVENLLFLLDAAGIRYTLRPFMTPAVWEVLYKGGSLPQKAAGIVNGYLRRWKTLLTEARHYDWVFIHREAAPLGPPLFEWYLKKVLGKKIIYDFDDAIWIPNTSAQNRLAASLKAFWKVGRICRWSHAVVGGNDYLCRFAQEQGASQVRRIPTVVDTAQRYNQLKQHHDGKVTVGWTGSHSTLKYLDEVLPVIARLQEDLDFTFLVIADKKPELSLRDWRFVPWNATTEIEDLLQIDIGLMPLTADPWSEGKCGFKLIQYLSLGIPAVASPVGVNKDIVVPGENGFLAQTAADWELALRQLIADAGLRRQLGAAGRQTIENQYSITANAATFLNLFES